SNAPCLSGFPAFRRCLVRRAARRRACRVSVNEALSTALVENRRRIRTRPRRRQFLRTPGLFCRRLLLGQADDASMGREIFRPGPPDHRCPHGHLSPSDAALRIVCDVARVFLSVLATQTQTLQWPGHTRVCIALLCDSLLDRIRPRRSARRYSRSDNTYRTLDFAVN